MDRSGDLYGSNAEDLGGCSPPNPEAGTACTKFGDLLKIPSSAIVSYDISHAQESIDIEEAYEAAPSRPEDLALDVPALAVVVDDCGFSLENARRLLARDLNFTWAIIPGLAHSGGTAELLRESGVPFLVHMPMQAMGDPDGMAGTKGHYVVGVGMTRDEVEAAMTPLIESLPGAYGMNNHRGSKATSDKELMISVMSVLRDRGMSFLDSSTSSSTVAYRAARASGIDATRNNYFMDNEADRAKVRAAFESVIEMAKKRGSAVGICHMRPETLAFFDEIDESFFTARGVRLVTLPQLVELRKEHDHEGQ